MGCETGESNAKKGISWGVEVRQVVSPSFFSPAGVSLCLFVSNLGTCYIICAGDIQRIFSSLGYKSVVNTAIVLLTSHRHWSYKVQDMYL